MLLILYSNNALPSADSNDIFSDALATRGAGANAAAIIVIDYRYHLLVYVMHLVK